MAASVSSLFESLKGKFVSLQHVLHEYSSSRRFDAASSTPTSKLEAAKYLGDLLQQSVQSGGIDDARTEALFADIIRRCLLLIQLDDASTRQAGAVLFGLATRTALSAAPGLAADLESLLSHSADGSCAGDRYLLRLSSFNVDALLAGGRPLLAHDPGRYAAEQVQAEKEGSGGQGRFTSAQRLLLKRRDVLQVLGLSSTPSTASGGASEGTTACLRKQGGHGNAHEVGTALAVTNFSDLLDERDLQSEQPQLQAAQTSSAAVDARHLLGKASNRSASGTESQPQRPSSDAGAGFTPSALSALADIYHELSWLAFHADWHVRHGAILSLHAMLVGLRQGRQSTAQEAGQEVMESDESASSPVVEDAVLRCIAVLALDRVDDFSGASVHAADCAQQQSSGHGTVGAAGEAYGTSKARQGNGGNRVESLRELVQCLQHSSVAPFAARSPVRCAAAAVLSEMLRTMSAHTLLSVLGAGILPRLAAATDWHCQHGAALAYSVWLSSVPALPAPLLPHAHACAMTVFTLMGTHRSLSEGPTSAGNIVDGTAGAHDEVCAVAASCVASLLVSDTWRHSGIIRPLDVLTVCVHLLARATEPTSTLTASVIQCALFAMDASGTAAAPVQLLVQLCGRSSVVVRHPEAQVRSQALALMQQCLRHASPAIQQSISSPSAAAASLAPEAAYLCLLCIVSGTLCALLEQGDARQAGQMHEPDSSNRASMADGDNSSSSEAARLVAARSIVLDCQQAMLSWAAGLSGPTMQQQQPFFSSIESASVGLVFAAASYATSLPSTHALWLAQSWLPVILSLLSGQNGDAITEDHLCLPLQSLPAALVGDRNVAPAILPIRQASPEACPMDLHKRALGCVLASHVLCAVIPPPDCSALVAAHLQAAQQQNSESSVALAALLAIKVSSMSVKHACAIHSACLPLLSSLRGQWTGLPASLSSVELRPFMRDLQTACADLHACMLSANIPVALGNAGQESGKLFRVQAAETTRSRARRTDKGKAGADEQAAEVVSDTDSVMSALLSFHTLLPTAESLLCSVASATDSLGQNHHEEEDASTGAAKPVKRRKVQHSPRESALQPTGPMMPSDIQLHASRVRGLVESLQGRAQAMSTRVRGLCAAAELAPLCAVYRRQTVEKQDVDQALSLLPAKLTGSIRSLLELASSPVQLQHEGSTGVADAYEVSRDPLHWLQALACDSLVCFTAWCHSVDHSPAGHAQLDVSKIGHKILTDLLPPSPTSAASVTQQAYSRQCFVIAALAMAAHVQSPLEQHLLVRFQESHCTSTAAGRIHWALTCSALMAAQTSHRPASPSTASTLLLYARQQLLPLLSSIPHTEDVHAHEALVLEALALCVQAYLTHDMYHTVSVLLPCLSMPASVSTSGAGGSAIYGSAATAQVCAVLLSAIGGLLSEDASFGITVAPGSPAVPLATLPLRTVCAWFVPFIVSRLNDRDSGVRHLSMRAMQCVVRCLSKATVLQEHCEALPPEQAQLQQAAQQGLAVLDMLNSSAREAWARLPMSVADAFADDTTPGGRSTAPRLNASAPAAAGHEIAAASLPFAVNLPLRRYQLHGIGWLTSLARYNLCGILADDMGLGKTVQALAALALWLQDDMRRQGSPALSLVCCPTTLVQHWKLEFESYFAGTPVSTLITPVLLEGGAQQRAAILKKALAEASAQHHVLLITSHATLRMDAAGLAAVFLPASAAEAASSSAAGTSSSTAAGLPPPLAWFILDESHICSNASSALHQAVCQVSSLAQHRVALTGTPVSNSVGELWATFHWLMPAYLGDRRTFDRTIAKPITKARSAQATMADAADARSALRRLHSCLLPFVLRRTKGEVLRELPQKSIVDMPLPLVPTQRILYDAFVAASGTQWAQAAIRALEAEEGDTEPKEIQVVRTKPTTKAAPTIPVSTFTAITTLRQICSHPVLVTDQSLLAKMPGLFGHDRVDQQAGQEGGTYSMQHSCKLLALHSLLQQLGILPATDADGLSQVGSPGPEPDAISDETAVDTEQETSPVIDGDSSGRPLPPMVHEKKALIFAQSTRMLDAVEEGVLRLHWAEPAPASGITRGGVHTSAPTPDPWLRIDGSTPAGSRAGIAARFGSDPSIRLLLLTTGAAGLGLNLVAADTVIFLEHDWNPTRDLQAMDRAHRLGQTRPVTVYRLLAQDTLEERIMGLQRFKLSVANAVLGSANAAGASGSADGLSKAGGGQHAPGSAGALEQMAGLEGSG